MQKQIFQSETSPLCSHYYSTLEKVSIKFAENNHLNILSFKRVGDLGLRGEAPTHVFVCITAHLVLIWYLGRYFVHRLSLNAVRRAGTRKYRNAESCHRDVVCKIYAVSYSI